MVHYTHSPRHVVDEMSSLLLAAVAATIRPGRHKQMANLKRVKVASAAAEPALRSMCAGSHTGRDRPYSKDSPVERVLPPSGGPTQVGTTPRVSFRAVLGLDGESVTEVEVVTVYLSSRMARSYNAFVR